MNEVKKLISDCFDKCIFDDQVKKGIKKLAVRFKDEDINFLIKYAFDLFRRNQNPNGNDRLIDCLEGICNTLNALRKRENTVSGICFAPNDDCIGKMIEFINSAKDKLLICVFTISDDRLCSQILSRHSMGVEVMIITDNEKQYDLGSDIDKLVRAGIDVKMDTTGHHMHHKFAIADDQFLLTGSFNWTRSASESNYENFIILSDLQAIKRYKLEFERIWKLAVSV